MLLAASMRRELLRSARHCLSHVDFALKLRRGSSLMMFMIDRPPDVCAVA
jgi:hypothetical protein